MRQISGSLLLSHSKSSLESVSNKSIRERHNIGDVCSRSLCSRSVAGLAKYAIVDVAIKTVPLWSGPRVGHYYAGALFLQLLSSLYNDLDYGIRKTSPIQEGLLIVGLESLVLSIIVPKKLYYLGQSPSSGRVATISPQLQDIGCYSSLNR